VAGSERDPLVLGEQPAGAPEVQWQAGSVQYGGEEAGSTGQSPQVAGGHDVSGVEPSGADRTDELVVVEGDHHGRRRLGVEAVGRKVLEQLDEGEPGLVRPVAAIRTVAGLGGGGAHAGSSGRGHRVDHPGQDRAWDRGDREVPGEGAVGVLVEGEPGLGERLALLVADHLTLVGIDDGPVGLDRRQRSARFAAQLSRVQPLGPFDQMTLDRLDGLGVEPLRERRGRLHDHRGVVGGDRSGRQRLWRSGDWARLASWARAQWPA
jgi:hypothetical protein